MIDTTVIALVGLMVTMGGVVAGVSWRLSNSITSLGGKIDSARLSIDGLVDEMKHLDGRVDQHDRRLDNHESRIERIEDRGAA